jgi:hypothetical protein
MRYSLLFVFTINSSLFAAEDTYLGIIKAAVEVHGGKANLTKLQNYHYTSKGTIHSPECPSGQSPS